MIYYYYIPVKNQLDMEKLCFYTLSIVICSVTLVLSKTVASGVEVSAGGVNHECSQKLRSLLANIDINFDLDNDTLAVTGFKQSSGNSHPVGQGEGRLPGNHITDSAQPALDSVVSACSTDLFNVELWRAIQSPNRPTGFGTWEYFSKFQNCENPNPDLLWKHGTSIQESLHLKLMSKTKQGIGGDTNKTGSTNLLGEAYEWRFAGPVKFFHVVERQYLIRMCPCRRLASGERKCSCDHGSNAVCSEIMNVTDSARKDQVFPWCRGQGDTGPTPMIGTPEMLHCPSKVCHLNTLPK